MHVALVANTAWLDEELPQFRYLVVGLIDEQVRVSQVLPEGVPVEDVSAFGQSVPWHDSSWSVLRRLRLSRVSDALEQLDIGVIHALDGRVWSGALSIARRLEIPVLLGAGSALDVTAAERLRRPIAEARATIAATTGPLAAAITQAIEGDAEVLTIPPGVHVGQSRSQDHDGDSPLCAVISGPGQADPEYHVLFEAIGSVVATHPQTQFFLDSQGRDPHALWRMAERFGLLANMSMVPRRLGHRELLLRADVLVHPLAQGRSRSLTLAAMAAGIPVVARQDPWLDYLVHDQTAWTIDEPDPRQWERWLSRVIEHREEAAALSQRARQWVSQHHVASQQVEATLAAYRNLTAEAIKFPGQGQ